MPKSLACQKKGGGGGKKERDEKRGDEWRRSNQHSHSLSTSVIFLKILVQCVILRVVFVILWFLRYMHKLTG